MPKMRYFWKKV